MMDRNGFDPDNICKKDMETLAGHIEEYLNTLKEVMIIPRDMIEEHGKRIKRAIEVTAKLIKKLRKGDKSVFKDMDEDNDIF